MFNFEDIEVWDIVKVDTTSYNRYVWLAKVLKKSDSWDWTSNNSLCIWITPLGECIQKKYWVKPKEIIEIENKDKYKNIDFKFIKL